MAAPIKVLDLDSLADRPIVLIDKHEYELLTPEILPPLDAHRLSTYLRRLAELMKKAEVDESEQQELDVLPSLLCALVLNAPDEIRAKLTPRQKTAIVATFFRHPRELTPAEEPTTATATAASAPTGSTLPNVAVPSTEGIH